MPMSRHESLVSLHSPSASGFRSIRRSIQSPLPARPEIPRSTAVVRQASSLGHSRSLEVPAFAPLRSSEVPPATINSGTVGEPPALANSANGSGTSKSNRQHEQRRILLMRHGESEGNVSVRDVPDPVLTGLGVAQAKSWVDQMSEFGA